MLLLFIVMNFLGSFSLPFLWSKPSMVLKWYKCNQKVVKCAWFWARRLERCGRIDKHWLKTVLIPCLLSYHLFVTGWEWPSSSPCSASPLKLPHIVTISDENYLDWTLTGFPKMVLLLNKLSWCILKYVLSWWVTSDCRHQHMDFVLPALTSGWRLLHQLLHSAWIWMGWFSIILQCLPCYPGMRTFVL